MQTNFSRNSEAIRVSGASSKKYIVKIDADFFPEKIDIMKCLFLALILASGMVFAAPGGYIHKGGVIDFQKPLDYMDHAVHAGRVSC